MNKRGEKEKREKIEVDSKKSLLFLGIGFLVCLGLGCWQGLEIKETTNRLQKQRGRLDALNQREENYQKLQQDYQSIKGQYQRIDQAIPDQNNFVAFIVMLEKEAQQQSVGLEFEFPDQPEIENNLLSFSLRITGKRNNVLKYLTEVKDSLYYIEIASAQLDKAGSQAQIVGDSTIKVGVDETFQPNQISS